ncbi:MAG: glycosyltransferase [Candidatus Omnitrophota bacterium]
MTNKQPFVSIIIAHFNGKEMIKDCLDALYGIAYPKNKFEVIVVDNGSTDGSVRSIKNKYKKAIVLVNKINNYCKACNLGIVKSKREYVVLLNNDVVVGKRWLAELVKVIKSNNSIGAVTSKLFSGDTIQNAGLVGLPNFYWDERGAGKKVSEYNSIAEVDAISGTSVLYRRSALDQAGLLDEDFVMFGEDVDLSLRMKKHGWKLVYVPGSLAYHKKHGSCDERFAHEAIEKNRLLLVAKHYPHKLPSALIGNEYFIVKEGEQKSGRFFMLLPDIMFKLNKEHQGAIFNEVARDVFDELEKLVNYENKRLEEELKNILNDLIETRKDRDYQKNQSNQLQSRMNEVLIKDGQLIEKDTQISSLSSQLHSRMNELVLKSGELLEGRAEAGALKEELARLAEDLATKIIDIEENKEELTSYKDELSNLSNQLQSRMNEVLIKDGQLIEKDTQISSLSDQVSALNQRIKQQLDSLTAYKEELNNLSNQLQRRMEEIVHLRSELHGIYNSEGFRFVLRPLWTVICSARASFRLLKHSIKQLIWFTIAISLTPFFLFLSVSFLIENIFWRIFKPLLSIIVPKRRLVPFEDLKISLVIPNWNGIACLKECLPSVFSVKDFKEGKSEVLVVDDGSTDDSVEYIKSNFPQVRLILNRKNKGFGFTCNRGVKQAKNELIVLINNDVVVTENFLEPLISHFRENDVFAVTPKMYGWDRKTFVWGMHTGHFENGYIRLWNESETGNGDRVYQPSPSVFAIGGGMVFRKKDFLWLGGFDDIYKPNCWEDIDISYRAWKRGLKIIYEPSSVIYHKGKVTLTYERQKEIKNELLFTWKNITDSKILNNHLNLLPKTLYQNKNRVAFVKGFFWAFNFLPQAILHRFLEKRFIVEQDSKIFNRIMLYYGNFVKRGFKHHQGTKPNVLVISRFFPFPLNVGGKIRIHTLTKLLSEKYNFHLLSLIDHYDEYKFIPELKKVFAEVYPVLAKSELNLDFFSRLFYPARYKAAYSYSQELIDRLIEIQKKEPIDIIQIESNELLYLLDYIKHIPVVYTEHDISFLASKKSYYRTNNSFIVSFLDDLNRFHFHTSRFVKIDKVITLSKEDEDVLRALFPRSDINLVPTGVDLEHFSFQDKPRNSKKLIYVGHYRHYPNEDAVVYFAKKIFPLIRKKMPGAEFWIVGSNPTSAVKILAKEKSITVTGEVNDVKPYLDESSVFVNSNCVGAGIKGKVLEAMATGLPVVSTKVGSSGIDAKADEEILIADNPRAFANKVIKIITDNNLRERLIVEARWLVEKKYDWLKIIKKLDKLYQGLLWGNPLDGSNTLEIDKVIDKTNKFVEKKIDCLKGCLMKPEDGPEELHIELTYNCNSKCIMCDLWDYEKRFPGRNRNELSLDEIKRLVDNSAHLQKTKTVVLSGGEPFLRKDIAELCGFFNRNLPNSSIGILTNAMATDIILDKSKEILDRFQPRSLWLGSSLDGIGKAHDRIRGIDGAFSTFYKTIRRCKKELPSVKLSTTFTLTPHNLDQLLPVKQFADREELDFFAQFVVPKEGREKFRWTAANLQTVEGEIKEIIQELLSKDDKIVTGPMEKIKDKNLITQLYYWSNLVEYQTHPKRLFKRCITGSKFAMLSPYGDLFFCPILKNSSIGNIREEKFDHLWMSEKAQGIRKFIEEGNCHCWLVCIIFPILEKVLND